MPCTWVIPLCLKELSNVTAELFVSLTTNQDVTDSIPGTLSFEIFISR